MQSEKIEARFSQRLSAVLRTGHLQCLYRVDSERFDDRFEGPGTHEAYTVRLAYARLKNAELRATAAILMMRVIELTAFRHALEPNAFHRYKAPKVLRDSRDEHKHWSANASAFKLAAQTPRLLSAGLFEARGSTRRFGPRNRVSL